MSVGLVVLGVALAVGLALFVYGLRDPLSWRLGVRNVLRHRRQTLTVVVGLLAGTAVIGASLVTGDSLAAGLHATAIDAVGETDVVVHIPGNLYVPQALHRALLAPPLPGQLEAGSSIIVESAAVEHPAEDLYEPSAVVMGVDPEEDRPFGPWTDATTGDAVYGEELGPREVYVNQKLAGRIGAAAGDELVLTYRLPFVPFVPQVTWLNDTLVAARAVPDGAGGYVYLHSDEDVYETTVEVPAAASGLFAVVAWSDPTNATDLDVELVDPTGRVFRNTNGSVAPAPPGPLPVPTLPPADEVLGGPDNPAFLFVEKQNATEGTWTFRVHGKNAQNQFYTSFVAVLVPEYDLQRAVSFAEDLEERFGEQLADDLDPRSVQGAAQRATVTVKRVVAMAGKGIFFNADAVFMHRDAAEAMYDVAGRANWLRVTNVGDAEAGLSGSSATVRFLEERIEALQAEPGTLPVGALDNLEVEPLKQRFVTETEEAATIFTQFLTLIGSFTLVAGVMLIVNIFSMLAEERRHELGIARAVGLTRRRLVLAFTFEGSLYTLVASAIGVLVGMGMAAILVWGINSLAPPDAIFRVPYRAEPGTLMVSFAAGALITFATVLFASYRASRLNIVRAIRDLDEVDDPKARSLVRRALVLGLLVGATLLGVLLGSYLALVVGPALVALAAAPLLSRLWGGTRAWVAAAVAVIVYTLVGFVLFPGPDTLERDLSTVVRGVVLVIAATVLLVQIEAIPRAVAWSLSRSRRLAPVARVATTYPLHRRFRTGLTLSMYALVLFIIVVFSVFFTMFTPDLTQESGGYHVMGDSQVAVDDLRSVEGVAALAGTDADPFRGVVSHHALVEHFEFGDDRLQIDGGKPQGFSSSAYFIGFDAAFADDNGFPLDVWDPAYGPDARAVYRRVAEDPSLVLVSYTYVGNLSRPDGRAHGPGATLTVETSGGTSEYTIAGVMEQTLFGGIWMQKAEVERLYPDHDGFYLFRLADDVDPGEAAKRIERAFRPIGLDADDIQAEAAEVQAESARIYQLFQAYLGLGLVVGVASIGIVTSRAVLERRREIGMLKAIGFTRSMVAAAFLVEVLLILAAASLIGIVMGIAVARMIWLGQLSDVPGLHWVVPWGRIGQMLGLALVATFVAALWPARRASRVPAAEALRTTE